MAGIAVGSSDRLTSPIPHLLNAVFDDEAGRFASGQLRNTAWDYHQKSPATYWRIKPLALCFVGSTPATQAGTWGTVADHWIQQGSGGAGAAADLSTTGVLITPQMVQSDGSVRVPVPSEATFLFDVQVYAADASQQTDGLALPIWRGDWQLVASQLRIAAIAGVVAGNRVSACYFAQAAPPASSPNTLPATVPFTV